MQHLQISPNSLVSGQFRGDADLPAGPVAGEPLRLPGPNSRDELILSPGKLDKALLTTLDVIVMFETTSDKSHFLLII